VSLPTVEIAAFHSSKLTPIGCNLYAGFLHPTTFHARRGRMLGNMRLDVNRPSDLVFVVVFMLAVGGALLTGTNPGFWILPVLIGGAPYNGLRLISDADGRFSLLRLLILVTAMALVLGLSAPWYSG
jgi:hypothetical protein